MRVVVACDKFKGSLTSAQAGEAVRLGLLAVDPALDVDVILVADGGEGTIDAILSKSHTRVPVNVSGPTGEPVQTAYAVAWTERPHDLYIDVVVELADACGMSRLPGGVPAPLDATSRGLGEVILEALHHRPTRMLIGLGGSASTDGGVGMLAALGAHFFDVHGHRVQPSPRNLCRIDRFDGSALPAELGRVRLEIASDVDAPLTGPRGAATVFGPQKGANPDQVAQLEAGLTHWADVVARMTRRDLRDAPGAGAAGGVGFAIQSLLGGEFTPGVETLLRRCGFTYGLESADLVITGEGSLDAQTLLGKAPLGVARQASGHGIPVIALCGRCELSDAEGREAGFAAVHALSELEPDPHRSMTHAASLLSALAGQSFREFLDRRD